MTFDPTKPVRTRDGREARILATDIRTSSGKTIVAAMKSSCGTDIIATYYSDGKYYEYDPNCQHNLVNIPERVERWVNVFPIQYGWSATNHKTKADADYTGECRVGLVKLVFEDGKLVEVTLEK